MSVWTGTLLRVLLDSSLRTLFIAAGVAGILAMVRARSSSVRHAAWTAVLCAMLLMPVLPHVVPSIRVSVRVPSQPVQAVINRISESPSVPRIAQSMPTVPAVVAELNPQSSGAIVTPARGPIWPIAIAVLYGAGLLMLLFRLVLGWRGMRRIAQASERILMPGTPPIYQSGVVATPMTIGIMSPKIILPSLWCSWPKAKLRAILAHEIAHIRRRDPIIGFLAHLNCCVFWFHPMAWWLERKLAVMAEYACDDAALHVIGHTRRYTEILLDMAESVRRRRGRLVWQGVGVHGDGLLGQRIDRILYKGPLLKVSRTRKMIIAWSCAAVIVLVVACQQHARPSLEEEQQALVRVYAAHRERTARIEQERARQERLKPYYIDARNLTAQQVSDLESNVEKSPDDFDPRMKLLGFYSTFAGKADATSTAIITARRKHILWLIRFHPEDDLAGSPLAFINTGSSDPIADPEGYAAGKKLWLAHTENPDASVSVLSNAAYFLEVADKPLAEKILLRAQELQPDLPWAARFARLYASMILGATAVRPPLNDHLGNFVVLAVSAAEAHTAYADDARKKLDSSGNYELLTMVGQILMYPRDMNLDFDPVALGKQYIARAAAINPKSEAHYWMAILKRGDRQARIRQLLPKDGRYEAASALPDRDRFELFWELALNSYSYGNSFDEAHLDAARKEWDKSRKYAADLVKVASKFRSDPEYGNAIFHGNVMLGFVAGKNGDGAGALKYLREALKAPDTTEAARWRPGPWAQLCSAVIDYGDRDAVIEFLRYFAQIDPTRRDDLLASAAELRNSQMPSWYRRAQLEQAVPSKLR